MKNSSISALLFIVLSFTCLNAFGQIDANGKISNQQYTPRPVPASPTAGELGKYGDVPIGMFTGAMEYTIPLYHLTVGKLSLPISLNYRTNGVKVSEYSTNVGLSWSLNAGGIITRSILGGDDYGFGKLINPPNEFKQNHALYNLTEARQWEIINNYFLPMDERQNYMPDVYYYNFGKYSGKFVIDADDSIIPIPYNNLNIKQIYDGPEVSFSITTPDGDQYYFSKRELTLYSTSGYQCIPSDGALGLNGYTSTTWYLTKIKDPEADSIMFIYEPVHYMYNTGISQTISILRPYGGTSLEYIYVHAAGPSWFRDSPETPDCIGSSVPNISTCVSVSDVEGYILKTIQASNGQKVSLTNSSRTDISGAKKTDKIEFYPSTDAVNPIKSCNLYYSNDAHNYRMYLDSIIERGSATERENYYGFEYKKRDELPSQISTSQDLYGYYNGKSNPQYFVPRVPGHFYFDTHYGNRTSDSTYSTLGTLNKIIYPTSGYSKIIYDSHRIIKHETVSIEDIPHLSVGLTTWGTGSNPYVASVSLDTTFTTPIGNNFDSAIVFIQGDYRNFQNPDSVDPNYQAIEYEIRNMNTNQVLEGHLMTAWFSPISVSGFLYPSTDLHPYGDTRSILTSLDANTTYHMKLIIHGGEQIYGHIGINAYEHTGNYYNVDTLVKRDYGGARVDKIITHDDISGKDKVVKYYYSYLDSIRSNETGTSLHLVNSFNSLQASHTIKECTFNNSDYDYSDILKENIYDILSSSPVSFSLGGNHVYYESVVEGIGNNFEGGGTEHHYLVAEDQLAKTIYHRQTDDDIIDAPLTNSGYMNGTETYTSVFKKEGNAFVRLNEVFNSYTVESTKNAKDVYGYQVERDYVMPYPYNGDMFPTFKVAQYNNISRWYYLNQKKTVAYDKLGQNPITTIDKYFYDNPNHILLTRHQQENSDGKIFTSIYTYPKDYANGALFINNMKANNLMDYRIEQIQYENNGSASKMLSGHITTYLPSGNGLKKDEWTLEITNPIALGSFKFSNRPIGCLPIGGTAGNFAKDPKYKLELTYDKYDNKGNLLSYTAIGSETTVFLWGYKGTYPVAQIEHVDTAALTTYLNAHPTIQTTCNNPASDQALRNVIQQLRNQFPNALITGMTYRPPLGMTSKTGPNNVVTYYDYDSFGRLADIKDKDGKILKKYTYHYKQ